MERGAGRGEGDRPPWGLECVEGESHRRGPEQETPGLTTINSPSPPTLIAESKHKVGPSWIPSHGAMWEHHGTDPRVHGLYPVYRPPGTDCPG